MVEMRQFSEQLGSFLAPSPLPNLHRPLALLWGKMRRKMRPPTRQQWQQQQQQRRQQKRKTVGRMWGNRLRLPPPQKGCGGGGRQQTTKATAAVLLLQVGAVPGLRQPRLPTARGLEGAGTERVQLQVVDGGDSSLDW